MKALFRFRRFRTRLLVLFVGLLAVLQVAAYVLVTKANRANALVTIEAELEQAGRRFREITSQRQDYLRYAAGLMASDYAMKQLFLADEFSPATARSALASYQGRVKAPVIVLLDASGSLLSGTRNAISAEDVAPFNVLRERAELSEEQEASGYGYFDGELHQMVLVPLLAPPPEVVAWVGIGFPINAVTARELKETSDVEVTFLSGDLPAEVIATTLPASKAADLARTPRERGFATVLLQSRPYITSYQSLPVVSGPRATVALQSSLEAKLAPSVLLERVILIVALAGLAAAIAAAVGVARNLSQPVQQLAAATRHVATGDYTQRIDLQREDELGQLAQDFNQMSAGLAERDRVRDLLGKVVSPEIATQLLHSDLQLGGEEREVTILFCDLRDFTGMSERMAPTEVLSLLNRYLDRMSSIVEKHGGVVDKYIGDAIMALFGAPVALADGAARAVAAAREMGAALDGLNRELQAEGRAPLAFGIGINTARVIAGNMGSKTRLNYTVVGDGVNLAARIEALSRDPSYRARIIVSAATAAAARAEGPLRALGDVVVKGKSEAVQIYAVDA